jgi:hypothetical protein
MAVIGSAGDAALVLAWCALQRSSRVLLVCLCCLKYVLLVFPCLKTLRMCVHALYKY